MAHLAWRRNPDELLPILEDLFVLLSLIVIIAGRPSHGLKCLEGVDGELTEGHTSAAKGNLDRGTGFAAETFIGNVGSLYVVANAGDGAGQVWIVKVGIGAFLASGDFH